MTHTSLLAVVLFTFAGFAFSADEKYEDPDSPAVQAAAVQALKSAQIRPITGKTLDIVGVTRGVTGIIQELGGKVTDREVKLELAADVLFDFNKADLRPEGIGTLRKVSDVIKTYGKAPVLIEGHTDSVGSDDYNMRLSEQRAQSVKTWMQTQGGIDASRMTIKGWGESKPVAPNTTPDGKDNPENRKKNRRVEITIKKL